MRSFNDTTNERAHVGQLHQKKFHQLKNFTRFTRRPSACDGSKSVQVRPRRIVSRTPDAARWLVSERAIKAVGLDTASIDYGQSTLFESHRVLLGKNIPAFENLDALDKLPATGAYVVALPMKIKGGSGGPLRIVAWVGEKR